MEKLTSRGETERRLNPREAAQVLKVTERWMAHARFAGIGPAYYKLAGRIYYLEKDLLDYVASRRIDPFMIRTQELEKEEAAQR
jgi:hypothetical protein